MSTPFLIFGHRGSPKRFPENTLASFDEALRAGADGFETDLRLLSDGTAILYHDDELGERDIESLSAADLRAEHLSALAPYAERTTMVLEVKRSKWEDELLKHVGTWPNVIIASFDHSIIAELHRRGVSMALGITTHGTIVDIADYAARLGITWCFPSYRYVDREMVASLHERGIRVIPWTPNRGREWEALRAVGCDGVITDVPHEAVRWRAQA
ncbi:MAG TPA: glycerophosphodiester phosphodiesterase [Thermoanaerobaculia bacterium]|jgi:glycerophosphoryl diester phosphodiesterase|nr:glycerophosphodiester phosphodiesterase [Thermoanaerobaculia bacterium]